MSGVDANNDGIDDDASIGASFADPDGTLDPAADLTNLDNDPTDPDVCLLYTSPSPRD